MKNIHVLPTDKEDFIIFKNRHLGDRLFHWNMDLGNPMNRLNYIGQNIYITSDEEIKEGDWVIKKYETKFPKSKANEVLQVNKINTNNGYLPNGNYYNFSNYLTVVVYDRPFQGSNDNDISRKSFNNGFKKIILTTDVDLIKDGVQAIDDEFLEWFVKNPSCEFAHLGFKSIIGDSETKRTWKIIIPKEECIDILDMGQIPAKEEPKQKTENLKNFKKLVSDEISPAMKEFIKEKQETLEEVKDLAYYKANAEEDYLQVPISVLRYISQLEQEQDKKMYSEEDMVNLIQFLSMNEEFNNYSSVSKDTAKYFLKQFKKK